MSLTEDAVKGAFELILGRAPKDDAEVQQYLELSDTVELRRVFLDSLEFKTLEKIPDITGKWVMCEVLKKKYLMWINLADKFVSFGCLIDNYEPVETSSFRRLLRPDSHVVDLGANVGWYTLQAADILSGAGRILSVEPNPVVFGRLASTVYSGRSGRRLDSTTFRMSRATGKTHSDE